MTISTSDLDFSSIKAQLKTYLSQSDEFSDYNFEASGLSNILDVLAYNTHLNGLVANMAINESFLSTAQLRSSVLQHAEALGYYPKSATSATAIVNVTVEDADGPELMYLPRGTKFLTDVDDVTYQFISLETYTAEKVGSTYTFNNVVLSEGSQKVKTFIIGDASDEQVFVIPDAQMDTASVQVKLFDNFTTAQYTPYTNINNAITVNEESTVYMLREAANGQYEIFFGDGNVLGKRPVAGNKLRVEYLRTQGAPANDGVVFETAFAVNSDSVTIETVAPSAGGSSKESIKSIKTNAPRMYASQQRLVTADDYTSLIMSSFSNVIDDIICWGGNENQPPKYGVVFVALKFKEGLSDLIQDEYKRLIKDQLTSNLSIMSIDTEFVEPNEAFLELTTHFNIDPAKSGETVFSLEGKVKTYIDSYVQSEVGSFGSVFRRSNLLSSIDSISEAILNSRMSVRIQQRVTDLNIGEEKDYTVNFPVVLASPDKDTHTVTTSIFRFRGQNVIIKNELGSTRLQIFDLDDVVQIANVGSYDPAKGEVFLNALRVDEHTTLKVSADPANQATLRPLRNYIVSIDPTVSSVSGTLESSDVKVNL
jgi:hypothetical protein